MTHKKIYQVPITEQLIITLPEDFRNKKEVLVTIDDITDVRIKKLELMKEAANDHVFLSDMEEVNLEFAQLEYETL